MKERKENRCKDGIKVTIYSKNVKEFLNVKVSGALNDLADFNIRVHSLRI